MNIARLIGKTEYPRLGLVDVRGRSLGHHEVAKLSGSEVVECRWIYCRWNRRIERMR